jgi:hypothetical protein
MAEGMDYLPVVGFLGLVDAQHHWAIVGLRGWPGTLLLVGRGEMLAHQFADRG